MLEREETKKLIRRKTQQEKSMKGRTRVWTQRTENIDAVQPSTVIRCATPVVATAHRTLTDWTGYGLDHRGTTMRAATMPSYRIAYRPRKKEVGPSRARVWSGGDALIGQWRFREHRMPRDASSALARGVSITERSVTN